MFTSERLEPVSTTEPLSTEPSQPTSQGSSAPQPSSSSATSKDGDGDTNSEGILSGPVSNSKTAASVDVDAAAPAQPPKVAPTPSSAVLTTGLSGREEGALAKQGKKHPLQNAWTLYYDLQRHHGQSSSDQYEATLKCVGQFTSLESFFDTFSTLHRPSRLEKNANYHLFKRGVKPMWEDPANAQGGRWVITLRDRGQSAGSRAAHEALVDRSWMWLVLALIGETLDDDDIVTGAVCSLRGKGDRIALWMRCKEPVDQINRLGQKLMRLLELENEPSAQLEFGVNFGSKETGYMRQHASGKGGTEDARAPAPQAPALEEWLESEATLHPADHMRYMAQVKAKDSSK